MQRANRAQRAAVGGKVTPLTGTTRVPTRAQSEYIAAHKKLYGSAVKTVSKPDAITGHITLTVMAWSGPQYWDLDLEGRVLLMARQQSLFTEGTDD